MGNRGDVDRLGHFNVFGRAVGDRRVVEFGRIGLSVEAVSVAQYCWSESLWHPDDGGVAEFPLWPKRG